MTDLDEKLIGNLPVPDDAYADIENYYPFNQKQIYFLMEYQKDLNLERAIKDAGYTMASLQKFLDKETPLGQAMLREIREIQNEWLGAIKLNAPAAAKKHLALMKKFEEDYDSADSKSATKGMLAGTLAKMSDSSLKATGQYQKAGTSNAVKVEINIDLTSNAKDQPITVAGEVIHEATEVSESRVQDASYTETE